MKNLVVIFVILFSCAQHKSHNENDKQYGGEISFTANDKIVSLTKNAFKIADRNLELKSYLHDELLLEVSLCDGIAKTSYFISDTSANRFLYFPADGSPNYYPHFNQQPDGNNRGTVKIIDIDEKNQTMSGTFSAQLSRDPLPNMQVGESTAMNIVNGTFTNVPYEIEEGPAGLLQIAKVDGVDFKGALMSSSYGSIIDLTFSDKKKLLGFRFPGDIAIGEHDISEFTDYTVFPDVWYMDGLHAYKAHSGRINITEFTPNKHIKGTFNFEAISYPVTGKTKSITEGAFDITFSN